MLAFITVLVLGFGTGFARRGTISNLANARMPLVWLVFVGVGLQTAAQFIPGSANMLAYGLVIVSYAALFAFAGANWRRSGVGFIALGAALNYIVILANQGMPISAEAAARAGWKGPAAQQLVIRGKHFIDIAGGTRLGFLGDIIPLGGAPAVASVGDLVIWAGMVLLIQDLMHGPRGRRTIGAHRAVGSSATSAPGVIIDVRDAAPVGEARSIATDPGESVRIIRESQPPRARVD
ncbi:MAG: DUF5317 domain-containing protein [Actinomycetota bacterium]